MIVKLVVKNTILYGLFLYLTTTLNTNYTTKVITTNCYDQQYVSNNFWITNGLNYYNSAKTSLIKEDMEIGNSKITTYCKVKPLIINTIIPNKKEIEKNYDKITNQSLWKIENKISELEKNKKITLNLKKQILLAYIYEKILKNTLTYNNKKYVIVDPAEISTNDYSNNDSIAFINKKDTWNFIKIVLFDKLKKNVTVLYSISPLNTETVKSYLGEKVIKQSFMERMIPIKKNIQSELLAISILSNGIYNITVNNKNYRTMANLYSILYKADSENNFSNNNIVWANVSFNNGRFYNGQNYTLYDLNLDNNSYYYYLNPQSNILPYNWSLLSYLYYAIFYLITLFWNFSIILLFYKLTN